MGVRYEIEGIDWLRAHVDFDGEGCLLWPRFRDVNGYGRVSVRVDGKTKIRWAHRVMCELVNGPCPPDHEAAHSCGRGKFGCVHPKHLEWKTQTANQIDRAQHGTKSRGAYHLHPKLTPEKVREISAQRAARKLRERSPRCTASPTQRSGTSIRGEAGLASEQFHVFKRTAGRTLCPYKVTYLHRRRAAALQAVQGRQMARQT